MKKTLNLFFCLFYLSCTGNEYPKEIIMKCVSFRSTSMVPILEEGFDKMGKDTYKQYMAVKNLKDQDSIKNVVNILAELTEQKPVKLDDYDVRASITLDGKSDRYYFNWDRKHLIYQSNIYLMSKADFQRLADLVGFCPE